MLSITKNEIAAAGGFSINPITGEKPISGFMVSPYKDHEKIIPFDLFTIADLEKYISDKAELITDRAYIGGWIDNADLYMDISINVQNKIEAIKIAQLNNQLSIYDVNSGLSIATEA